MIPLFPIFFQYQLLKLLDKMDHKEIKESLMGGCITRNLNLISRTSIFYSLQKVILANSQNPMMYLFILALG